jgi:hypothetical protein
LHYHQQHLGSNQQSPFQYDDSFVFNDCDGLGPGHLKVIREAWGARMAASHRPNFEEIELEGEDERIEGTGYRDFYLWPYINEEDLCKPHSLLLLMSTRARCHPSVLAATEHESHSIGARLLVFGHSSPGRYRMDLISHGNEDQFWARVVGNQVYRAHSKLEEFAGLKSLSEELRDLQQTHADVLETTSDFPEPYTDLLLQFRFHLQEAAKSLASQLGQAWNASPPVRVYYQREIETDPAAQVEKLKMSHSFHDDPTRARIYWLLSRLWSRDELFDLLGLTNIVDELQRLGSSEPATRCIPPHVGLLVGELALVVALLRQLELYQPWVDMHGNICSVRRAYMMLVHTNRSMPQLDLHIGLDKQDHSIGSLGAPTGGKFTYPVAKRRTRENVEAMRSAEENLDKLWRKVDEDIRSKSDDFWNRTLKRVGLSALNDADFENSLRGSGAAHRLRPDGAENGGLDRARA